MSAAETFCERCELRSTDVREVPVETGLVIVDGKKRRGFRLCGACRRFWRIDVAELPRPAAARVLCEPPKLERMREAEKRAWADQQADVFARVFGEPVPATAVSSAEWAIRDRQGYYLCLRPIGGGGAAWSAQPEDALRYPTRDAAVAVARADGLTWGCTGTNEVVQLVGEAAIAEVLANVERSAWVDPAAAARGSK